MCFCAIFKSKFHTFENAFIAVCKSPKSTLPLRMHTDSILLGVMCFKVFWTSLHLPQPLFILTRGSVNASCRTEQFFPFPVIEGTEGKAGSKWVYLRRTVNYSRVEGTTIFSVTPEVFIHQR